MKIFDRALYAKSLQKHYEGYFGVAGNKHIWPNGPVERLGSTFNVLEFPPNNKHKMWTYCSVGMSADTLFNNKIELIIYSPISGVDFVELIAMCASYHRTGEPLNLHHSINIGKPWTGNSQCSHGYISLPYLDGIDLEHFKFDNEIIHCYWLMPITEKERNYKVENGFEALEQLFEEKEVNYLDFNRPCLISGT